VLQDTAQGPKVKSVDKKGNPSYSVDGADERSFTTDWLTDKALGFMELNLEKPFCYMVSIPDPHGPDSVRAPYDTQYSSMTFEKPRTSLKSSEGVPSWAMPAKNCSFRQDHYFGMVKCIDDNVGRILKFLKDRKILQNTIVVFTSDHGDLRGEHGRHNKGVPLEASAKIPFVIYYPEKIKAGTVVRQTMGTVDFLPTILTLMGVKYTEKKEGGDLSMLFTGTSPVKGSERITFLRSTGEAQKGWLAAVTKDHKLVLSVGDDPWLIDLEKDPDELINNWDNPEYAAVRDRLRRALRDYGTEFKDDRVANPEIVKYL
jgi:arylsulfatase A-like enzyme